MSLFKIQHLPNKCHAILKSYLSERHLFVEQHDVITEIREMQSGVPQGSVLGPYLLYTADLSANANVSIAIFAAIFAMHKDPSIQISST